MNTIILYITGFLATFFLVYLKMAKKGRPIQNAFATATAIVCALAWYALLPLILIVILLDYRKEDKK